jgi:GT2 family glycosyltransferase
LPRLTVIIVNFNSGDRLLRCLDCLERQSFRDFETIVVDNGSADRSIARAAEKFPAVQYDEAGANLGFAAANNRAARSAAGDWMVLLNPDAYAEPSWLAELVAASQRYPWADAFGSTQIDARDPTKIDGAGDVMHISGIAYRGHFGWPIESLPPEGECFSPCAAAAMYRKSVFVELGGFDERFFCYGEDVDLGFRLRLAGARSVQLRNARVLHEGSGVTGRHSDFSIYHGHRNRIWLSGKNLPGLIFWGMLPLRVFADASLLIRFALVRRGVRPYLKALRDGYLRLAELRTERAARSRGVEVSSVDIARMLTWSPVKLARRQADLRNIHNVGS